MKRKLTKVTSVKTLDGAFFECLVETTNVIEIMGQEWHYERGKKAFCCRHFRTRLPFVSLILKKIYVWSLSVQES